jgi:choice-of-anchor C domain-containing protein
VWLAKNCPKKDEAIMRIKLAGCIGFLGLAVIWTAPVGRSAPAPEKPVNLIVNGSFEDGPEVERFLPLDEGSPAIKGWVVTRGQIDLVNTYWPAAEGKRSLDLNGSPGFGGIQQTFATNKGQKYRVTFSFAGNPEGSVAEKKMGVSAAGQKEEFAFDTTGKKVDNLGWVTKKWEFKADGKETTLEFYTLMTEDPNCGPALDNVIVEPIN